MGSGSLLKVVAKNFDVLAGSVSRFISLRQCALLSTPLFDFFCWGFVQSSVRRRNGYGGSRERCNVCSRVRVGDSSLAVRHCRNADASSFSCS
jgi:hypothetical protein